MTRNRKSAKDAGARFNRAVVDYLAAQLNDDRIDVRHSNGAKDRGDIGGVRHLGQNLVLEAKDYGGRFLVGPWLTEAEIERGNADAGVGLVVAKRRGTTKPADQVVFLTLRDLVSLLTGHRPEEENPPT